MHREFGEEISDIYGQACSWVARYCRNHFTDWMASMSRRPSNRAFNATASINIPTTAQSAAGEWARSGFTVRHASVRCRIQPTGTRSDSRLVGETVGSEFVVLMDAVLGDGTAVVVNHTDEIVVTRAGAATTYKAVGSPADQGGEGSVLVVPVVPTGADR